jgi:hypothetical protein
VNGSDETSAMAQRRLETLRDVFEKEGIERDRIVWLDWPDLRSNDPQADYRPAPNLFVKIEDVRPYSK